MWEFYFSVSGGDKIPRKGGPGITQSDLLVINKTDLAEAVGADLEVSVARQERTDCICPNPTNQTHTGCSAPAVSRQKPVRGHHHVNLKTASGLVSISFTYLKVFRFV